MLLPKPFGPQALQSHEENNENFGCPPAVMPRSHIGKQQAERPDKRVMQPSHLLSEHLKSSASLISTGCTSGCKAAQKALCFLLSGVAAATTQGGGEGGMAVLT